MQEEWNSNLRDREHYTQVGTIQLKERIFQGMHPHLRHSMQFLYMKDDVSYKEFLAAVYEAENDGTESKVLNVKVKAMTVEQVIDGKEGMN